MLVMPLPILANEMQIETFVIAGRNPKTPTLKYVTALTYDCTVYPLAYHNTTKQITLHSALALPLPLT